MDPTDGEQSDSTPIITIVGERVALGPLSSGLLPLIERWDNDLQTLDLAGAEPRPSSREVITATYTQFIRGERADWIGFVIYELPHLRPIGLTNLRDFTTLHRTAEFGLTIGEPDSRGNGYGTEATRLMLAYAFAELGVHNVWLDTLSTNLAALRAYTRAGFREIGRRRQAYRRGDQVADVVLMDCLATEFAMLP